LKNSFKKVYLMSAYQKSLKLFFLLFKYWMMELLFVWIENHNNIVKQGFNFSPEFWFEFDKEKKVLSYSKREGLPNDFFGENIVNVTAIVGENGSGKSSFIDLLKKRDMYHNILCIKDNNSNISVQYKGQILYFENNSKLDLCKYYNLDEDGIYDTQLPIMIYYSNFLFDDPFYTSGHDISTKHLITKDNYEDINIAFEKYFKFEIHKQIKFISNQNTFEIPFKLPKTIFLTPKTYNITKEQSDTLNKIKDTLDKAFKYKQLNFLKYSSYIDYIYNTAKNFQDIKLQSKTDLALENFYEKIYQSINLKTPNIIEKEIELEFKNLLLNLEDDLTALKFYNDFDSFLSKYSEHIRELHFPYWGIPENIFKTEDFIEILNNEHSHKFLNFSWSNLSTGEETFLSFYSRLFGIKDLISNTKQTYLLIIDEGEISMHPEWQKKYLKYLLQFINNYFDQKFQIILTSHSPFIVSDLPKENIIFLEKIKDEVGKDTGKMRVSDGVNHQNTFGANIHTLFSDAFFMQGGLIGDFAKGKIEELIKNINDLKNSKMSREDILKTIDMVGEPIIKMKLQELYREKIGESYEEKRKRLLKELEDLDKKENNKNKG
jgi:predicted ATPase